MVKVTFVELRGGKRRPRAIAVGSSAVVAVVRLQKVRTTTDLHDKDGRGGG